MNEKNILHISYILHIGAVPGNSLM